MSEVTYLRERAQDCRELAQKDGGKDAADALLELALIYEWQADCEQEREQRRPARRG
jgi:hypothetical protein